MSELKDSQKAAISYIEKYALERQKDAKKNIEEVLAMSDIEAKHLDEALHQITTNARVALHFHPDRLNANGQSVTGALLDCGSYRNQFETRLSNGMLSPDPGGPRHLWENGMFGDAYSSSQLQDRDRPKYGALDLMRHPDGPAPRFGSCYFLLKPQVSTRCTFSYMDSHKNPAEKGTLKIFDDIMAGLLRECFERSYALGQKNIRPAMLIEHLKYGLQPPVQHTLHYPNARNLDHYIEAQVHGPVNLEADVEFLIADPSFQSDPIGSLLQELCRRYNISLFWHPGFKLHVTEVPSDFRGPTMPSLAERISVDGWVDARTIGLAAAELKTNARRWAARGTPAQCLQELKLLWHLLVEYGKPFKTIINS